MRQLSLITPYISKNSILHRLHIASKLFLLFGYIVIIFTSQTPLALLSLCLLLVITTGWVGLPVRNRILIVVTILLLVLGSFISINTTIGGRLIIALGKIVCLMTILTLFSMTTKLNQTLQLVRSSSSVLPIFHLINYMISTTLAVLPGIQYDLQRAIDAETIRRGRQVKFYAFKAWVTILTVILGRALIRAERLADTVIDRGYLPSKGLRPLDQRPLQGGDVMLGLLGIIPGLMILKLTL